MTTKSAFFPALALLGLAAAAAPAQAQIFGSLDPNVIRCESRDSREVTCQVPSGRVATFEEQHSSSACTRGTSYWIYSDRIVVSRGCRASFRLGDAAVQLSELREELSAALASRIRSDNRFSSTPSITILSDNQRELGSGRIAYEGTARVTRNGSTWKTVEFSSTYDLRTRDLDDLEYWTQGTRGGSTSERRELLRDRLDDAMEDKLDAEFRNIRGANPRFELLTDEERTLSSTQSDYSGTGRISVDGREWTTVVFESVYDWRSNRFTKLDYRRSAGMDPGAEMDDDAERNLAAALATEVRRQLGTGNVQIVVNRRFATRSASGKVTYTGKFGYSWNDGEWVTRGYEAVLNPAGYNVRELRIFRLSN